MKLTDQLLAVAVKYCEAVRLSRGRVSTLVFGDGMRLDGIASGKDLNTRSYEKAMLWFSSNWPDALPWPDGIERPYPNDEQANQPEGQAA